MKFVFVSHHTEDFEAAERITNEQLSHLSNRCRFFMAEHHLKPGAKWVRDIKENLRRADAFVVLCSKKSLARDWVRYEIGAAWALGKPIYPVRLEEEPKEFSEPLSGYQIYDARRKDSTLQSKAVLNFLKELGDDPAPFSAESGSALLKKINDTLNDVKNDFKLMREGGTPQKLTFSGAETKELTRTFIELTNEDNKTKLGKVWDPLWQKYELVRNMWDRNRNWQEFEVQWSRIDVELWEFFPEIHIPCLINEDLWRVLPALKPYAGQMVEFIMRE
ncbi:toll/interleukin-1 receptor domain-containing protein [Desulfobacter curvatus]|uniref:toll/interleukin-1 receptor domain-containing protein n=1 Tax=Desulfobacter curvatus TaxID=2290 RepID=UPI00036C3DC9|nr:toll/interleukin-1 receptor domain-containing protein [Desulfobacter curvatus]